MTTQHTNPSDRLIQAYNTMLERVRKAFESTEQGALPALEKQIDNAREKALELEELTREEAERIGDYLKRDLEDAAVLVSRTGKGLADWLRFDIQLVEDRLLEIFSDMVDHTRMELEQLAQQAQQVGEWHTGEVVGIGTLECKACGEKLHFHSTGHIPPCPACHGTVFRRISRFD